MFLIPDTTVTDVKNDCQNPPVKRRFSHLKETMPNYEYACEKCEYVFDVIHSFKDKPAIICPKCSGTAKKQITSFYFSVQGASTSCLSREEIKQDLRENYGIEKVQLQGGSLESFYTR